eukprot:GHVQ01006055.1.p1 GENE.GHVQ01006055.1~~GHVQ01006055.1.p1  ORF type:complete len:206 (-),score=25.77 GHVQ01006055.1:998-1615(-)
MSTRLLFIWICGAACCFGRVGGALQTRQHHMRSRGILHISLSWVGSVVSISLGLCLHDHRNIEKNTCKDLPASECVPAYGGEECIRAPDTSPTPASTAITSAPADATTPGPTTAGPTTAGPTTAGPTTAGPTTAGHTTAGPTTPGATTPGATTPDDSEYFCMHIDETLCVCVCVFCDSVVYTLHALLCVCKRVGYLFVSIYLWVL